MCARIIIAIIATMTFWLFSACIVFAESPELPNDLVWGFFSDSKEETVLFVHSEVINPSEFATKFPEKVYRGISFKYPLNSAKHRIEMRQIFYGEDEWFPFPNQSASILEKCKVSPAGKVEKTDSVALVPGLHPDPRFAQAHAGTGPELLPGDYPVWHHWQGCRLYDLSDGRFALLDRKANLILIQPLNNESIIMKDKYKNLPVPMRVGKNPLLSLEEDQELAVACYYNRNITIVTKGGWLVRYNLQKGFWDDEAVQTFKEKVVLGLFEDESGLHALVRGENQETFFQHLKSKNDLWEVEGNGPHIDPSAELVYVDNNRCIVTQKGSDEVLQIKVFVLKDGDEWAAAKNIQEDKNFILADCLLKNNSDLFLLLLNTDDSKQVSFKLKKVALESNSDDSEPPDSDKTSFDGAAPRPPGPGPNLPPSNNADGTSGTPNAMGTGTSLEGGAEGSVAEATPFPWLIVIVAAAAALALGAITILLLKRAKKTAK